MKSNDIVISPVGAEEPNIHTVSVNGIPFNVAIQLELIVLVGEAINEQRLLSVDARTMARLFQYSSDNKTMNSFFRGVMHKVEKRIVDHTITDGDTKVENIAYDGIKYFVVYYLLIKHYQYVTQFGKVVGLLDSIIHPSKTDIKAFATYVTRVCNSDNRIGSKLFALKRNQILHSNDLTQPIWKLLYINSILRCCSMNYYIDWSFMKCVAKLTFSDAHNIVEANEGSAIKYIQTTAIRQEQLARGDIKELTTKLKEATLSLDYALDDIALIAFYSAEGTKLSSSLEKLQEFKFFEAVVKQYISIVSTLVKYGIIHNDPSFDNILLDGDRLVVVNYDKAILSSHHHSAFDVDSIREQLNILLNKKTISDNLDQVFNCYASYDIIRFGILLKRTIGESMEQHHAYLDNMIKVAVGVLKQIDAPSGITDDWIVDLLSGTKIVATPAFVSTRRKHVGQLRNEFLTKYVQSITHDE